MLDALLGPKAKASHSQMEPVVIIHTNSATALASNNYYKGANHTPHKGMESPRIFVNKNIPGTTQPLSMPQGEFIAIADSMLPENREILIESILGNDAYFENIELLSKSLNFVYESSLQTSFIKKSESSYFNPMNSSILPALQELYMKKMQSNPTIRKP